MSKSIHVIRHRSMNQQNKSNCKVTIIRNKDGQILSMKGNTELALFHKELLKPIKMGKPRFKIIVIKE